MRSWNGHAASEVQYDAGGRLLQDAKFVYTYDAEGNQIRREDRSTGHIWDYEWNSFGEMVRIVEPGGFETTFKYDGRCRSGACGQALDLRPP